MNRFTTLIVGTALTVTVDAGAALAGSPTPAPVDPVVPAPVAPMPVTGDWRLLRWLARLWRLGPRRGQRHGPQRRRLCRL